MGGDSSLFTRVAEQWRKLGATVSPGATSATLHKVESQYGINLPREMSAFYLAMNGMASEPWRAYSPTPEGIRAVRFWPVEELRLVGHQDVRHPGAYKDTVLFADYLISSHEFGVQLVGKVGSVVRVFDDTPVLVATSFLDFLRRYLESPADLA